MAIYTISNRPAAIQWEIKPGDWVVRTLQNCKNLLMLRMGDVPYDRYRGLDSSIYDKPIAEISSGLRETIERLFLYEPDAEVVAVRARAAKQSETGVSVLIEVDVSIDE